MNNSIINSLICNTQTCLLITSSTNINVSINRFKASIEEGILVFNIYLEEYDKSIKDILTNDNVIIYINKYDNNYVSQVNYAYIARGIATVTNQYVDLSDKPKYLIKIAISSYELKKCIY